MRIVSYNVNGLRSRLLSPPRTLATFLDSLDAEIICLQETKVARHELTADIAVAEGYESFFSCTRTVRKGRVGYSGVATFCRVGRMPSSTSPILPIAADEGFTGLLHRSETGEIESGKGRVGCYEEVAKTELSMSDLLQLDSEGRCLITDHGSFVLFNLYCPRVGCGDMDRLEFKLNFFHTLQRRWEALLKLKRRIIAVGDFNISPYPVDSCAPGPDFDKNICRRWLRSILRNEGGPFWDVFRWVHRDRKEAYTCWSQSSGAEEFNFGTRIDLVLAAGCCNHDVVPEASGHGFVECEVQDCDILSQFRRVKPDNHPRWQGGRSLKLEGSDHAPIIVHLREQLPVQMHEVPPLAARFMPEIRGRQQNLVSLLKRQPSPNDVRDAESNLKISRLEAVSEATDFPTWNHRSVPAVGRFLDSGESALLFNTPEVSPSKSVTMAGESRRMQGFLRSTINTKKQGLRAVQKSVTQQRDLHAFFASPSPQIKCSPAREEISQTSLIEYCSITEGLDKSIAESQQNFVENVDIIASPNEPNDTDEEFQNTPPDTVRGRQGSDEERNGIINGNVDQSTSGSQVEALSGRYKQMDAEHLLQVQQNMDAEEAKTTNVTSTWSRIKEKMAQAIPLCQRHDEPCVVRVVKKRGPNKGRGFYVCARAEGPSSNWEARCNHFEWASSFKKGGKLLGQKTDSGQSQALVKRAL